MKLLRVIARLLDYPTDALQGAKDALITGVLENDRLGVNSKSSLLRMIETLCDQDLLAAQESYVATFDRGRAVSLLLFEHVHGESRDRGQAMVDLMGQYTAAGLEIDARELPDYLPLFLEFLSTRSSEDIQHWLTDIHHILGLLAERLHQRESLYHIPFEALLELTGMNADRRQIAAIVANETRDDTPAALDKVWEEEMVTFLGDQGASCGDSGLVGQRRQELDQIRPVQLSEELMAQTLPGQGRRLA